VSDLKHELADLSDFEDAGAEKVMLVGSGGGHLAQLLGLLRRP
jgi:hypothetical protein